MGCRESRGRVVGLALSGRLLHGGFWRGSSVLFLFARI